MAESNEGVKHDGGKPPMHLIAWDAEAAAFEPLPAHESDHARALHRHLARWWLRADGARLELQRAFGCALLLAGDGSAARGLLQVARVLAFGAEKYAPRNWEKGLAHSRTFAAAQRHLCARLAGQVLDDESNLDHYAHAACEVMFALAFVVRRRDDLDDRPIAKCGAVG